MLACFVNAISGVPKTTLGCRDLLEGLTELVTAIISMVRVYCSEGERLKSVRGRSTWGRVPERLGMSFWLGLAVKSCG